MNQKIVLFFLLFFPVTAYIYSQGLTCDTSEPFCTGTIYTFPAGTQGSCPPGPYYDCLTPYTNAPPAWYHMLIDNPGPITIYMFSIPSRDIDFICWGPFADPYFPCLIGLTQDKVVDCDWSPATSHYCNIPNGQTGEYYILMITNWSRQPCDVTFSQTGGSGTTDCTILPPLVGNNSPLCVGETLELTAAYINNATYSWTGPAGFTSNLQNPTISNVDLANAGNYACVISVYGQSSDPAITTVNIFSLPTAARLTGDTTICYGTVAGVQFYLTGWGPYQIDYNDGINYHTATGLNGPIATIDVSPTTSPTTYYFTEVRDMHCARLLNSVYATVELFPQTTAILSGSASICAGEPVQLSCYLTGTPPWSITYLANGENPETETATSSPHLITVFPIVTTEYSLFEVTDIHCNAEISGTVIATVNPTPQAYAGEDQSIPHGASTVLEGEAGGGSGNYQYYWSPPEKLNNPYTAQPTVINLTEPTIFTLTVTDESGGCQGSDDVFVNITGGPLNCNPYASLPVICHNMTTQLYAMASGGSENFTYNWSSLPEGFSSTLSEPTVQPDQTTTYYVAVNDGYNVTQGSVSVIVHPRPIPDAGTDISVPHGTSTQLTGSASGGSGNYSYSWEPGELLQNPDVASPLTYNLYYTTLFSLTVTDLQTGCVSVSPGHVTVTVSGDALTTNPIAEPSTVCRGETTRIFSLAGGGSGNYTYSWSSDPPGFSSAEANPLITPLETSTYIVQINDGYNSTSGSCIVTVLDVPLVFLGPEMIASCVFDTVILDAGNDGASYLWSNGSTDRKISIASTGIGYDQQQYSVIVTDPSGCEASASITVVFDFSLCTGIGETTNDWNVKIFPNPGNGNLHFKFADGIKEAKIRIADLLGQNALGPARYEIINFSSDLVLQMGDKPEGIYIVHIVLDNRMTASYKYILKK